MSGCRVKIAESYENMSPLEKNIADYLMANTEEVTGILLGDLSDTLNISKASIIRFCKKLGYEGYRAFALEFAADAATRSKDNKYTDIQPGDTCDAIINSVFYNNKQSIDDTRCVLDKERIKSAVEAILAADRLEFFGVGASGLVAKDALQKFSRINKHVFCSSDMHVQLTSAVNMTKGDVFIAISYSGESDDVIFVASAAKNCGATIITITRFAKNTLSSLADISLFVSTPEVFLRSGAMGSRIGQLCVIDVLYSCVASVEYHHVENYLNRTYNYALSRKINKKVSRKK
jgi:DNA-binding MurR/RpiR family transcriptional regulator